MTIHADNPFADPAGDESRTHSTVASSASPDLYVGRQARLTLGKDDLLVSDPGLNRRSTYNLCGLLPRRSSAPQAVPYFNVLDASISDLELCIIHALPTSKRAVHPAFITYTLSDKSTVEAAKAWVVRLLDLSYKSSQRNKRLKILINPYGGQGTAGKLYARDVEPIFRAANCQVDIETTRYSGHAREIAQILDIDAYDAIICCSGDGTPHEVFNGLAKQQRPRRALRDIAVAQIPCGSGNAMSLNCNGTDSPSLAALAIVKAIRSPLDLVAITQGSNKYFSFLSQSVGIVAESDLGTDNIRWMGGVRFTVGFLWRLLGKTVYPADVAVKVIADDKQAVREHYRRTRAAHNAISAKRPDTIEQTQGVDHEDHDQSLPPLRFGQVSDSVPSDWSSTNMPTLGNFYCGNMTWMSGDAPFFPAALPNDNALDLVNIDGLIPRTTAISLLLSVEGNNFFDQPTVNYRKVAGYRITPRLRQDQREGFISIDGEKVPFEPFQAEVVEGLGTVLTKRGPVYEFDGPKEIDP